MGYKLSYGLLSYVVTYHFIGVQKIYYRFNGSVIAQSNCLNFV